MISEWIETYTGRQFEYISESIDAINIEDISHALSNLCRFAGNCHEFYSVAQHSYIVSQYVSPKNKLQALLHDATETYISDIPAPFKRMFPEVKKIENDICKRIFKKFNINYPISQEVKLIDIRLLLAERKYLFNHKYNHDWGFDVSALDINLKQFGIWSPLLAEKKFKENFKQLMEKR